MGQTACDRQWPIVHPSQILPARDQAFSAPFLVLVEYGLVPCPPGGCHLKAYLVFHSKLGTAPGAGQSHSQGGASLCHTMSPLLEEVPVTVCAAAGYRASPDAMTCPARVWVPQSENSEFLLLKHGVTLSCVCVWGGSIFTTNLLCSLCMICPQGLSEQWRMWLCGPSGLAG